MINENDYIKVVENIILPLTNNILSSENNKLYHAIKLIKEFNNKLLVEINKLLFFVEKDIVITDKIDRHKIAACFAYAIQKYSPFLISKKYNNIEDIFYANELLGIYTAISILKCYTPTINIIFPKTMYKANNINPYIKTLCTALYIGKNNKQLKYSILYFANILFLLEEFSKQNNTQ